MHLLSAGIEGSNWHNWGVRMGNGISDCADEVTICVRRAHVLGKMRFQVTDIIHYLGIEMIVCPCLPFQI